jgi:hypothetical protein
LYNQSGQQLNVSNQYKSVQAWVKATMFHWKLAHSSDRRILF